MWCTNTCQCPKYFWEISLYFIQVYEKDQILLTVNRLGHWREYYCKSMSTCVHVNVTQWCKLKVSWENAATQNVLPVQRGKKKYNYL